MNIKFKVTPSQKETIDLRVQENGFDDITSYIKVAALKMQKFTIRISEESSEEASVELELALSEGQKLTLEKNMKESNCEDMSIYLIHVALYGVISALIEIRSTGKLNAMLERIAKARGLKLDLD